MNECRKIINPLEYMTLVIFLSRSFYNGIGIQNIINISKYDSWISIIIGFIIGFIPILITIYLNRINVNLFELIKNKIIKFIIMIFIVISFTIILNDFVNFASLEYLFEMPNLFICILFLLPAIYIVNKGISVIARTSLFMFYISIILFILIIFSLSNYIDITNLKPILKDGFMPVLKGSIHFISYSILPILFLNIIPKDKYKDYNKKLIIGYIISSISIFIIIFYVSTIFNYQYTSLFNYPMYFSLKKIKYEFISNIENVLSLFFIIDYFFTVLTYMYIIKYYLNKEFKFKKNIYNIIYITIILLIIYISVYTYKNINIVHFINNNTYYILITFILLFITIIPFIIKKNN